MFEENLVSRVNETYTNLTCQVNSNANFEVVWTFITQVADGSSRRRRLNEGDRVDGNRVSVYGTTLQDTNGVDFTVTSTLIAPDIVLEQSVECLAESEFASRRSAMGAFEEITSTEELTTEFPTDTSSSRSILIPIWAIVLLVVLPALLTILAVMVRVVVYIIHRRKKNVKYKEAPDMRYCRRFC